MSASCAYWSILRKKFMTWKNLLLNSRFQNSISSTEHANPPAVRLAPSQIMMLLRALAEVLSG
jgi:hypothetical protein